MPDGFEILKLPNGRPIESQILAVHAALLRDGRVLVFSGSEHDERPPNPLSASARIFDPEARAMRDVAAPSDDLFCCGHVFLANGDLFVAGGTDAYPPHAPPEHWIPLGAHHFTGIPDAYIFHQDSLSWSEVAPMARGRWYPTCALTGDGRVFTISGHGGPEAESHEVTTFELFDPEELKWSSPRPTRPPLNDQRWTQVYYPRLHLLPSGRFFCASPLSSRDGKRTRAIDPASGDLFVLAKEPGGQSGDHVYHGSNFPSTLLPLEPPHYAAKILICGAKYPRLFDTSAPGKGWQFAGGARPYEKRAYANAVLLLDGSVLLVNGAESEAGYPLSGGGKDADAVLYAERYIPDTAYWQGHRRGTWERLSASLIPRVYHSIALLLSDGRVWIAGSNHDSGRNRGGVDVAGSGKDQRELRIEFYSPPYVSAPQRLALTGTEDRIEYDAESAFTVSEAGRVARAALVKCGSVTHAFDADQRYVTLTVTGRDATKVTVKGPPDGLIAPPGYYIFCVIDDNNVPSEGRIVFLQDPPPPPKPRAQRRVRVYERDNGDVDTKLTVALGEPIRIEAVAEHEIYAGVWFTGNNGPQGWDTHTDDPKFPYSGGDARPYSLLWRIGDGPYHQLQGLFSSRASEEGGRIFLRINDDCYGNGSGFFEATVAVGRS